MKLFSNLKRLHRNIIEVYHNDRGQNLIGIILFLFIFYNDNTTSLLCLNTIEVYACLNYILHLGV